MKRPNEVANAKALARHSVGYCSGNQTVNTQKPSPAYTQKEQTHREPRQCMLRQIEHVTEAKQDERGHEHIEEAQGESATREAGQCWHEEASDNRSYGQQDTPG